MTPGRHHCKTPWDIILLLEYGVTVVMGCKDYNMVGHKILHRGRLMDAKNMQLLFTNLG